jgi:3-hydroxyisobutyrate dehydrogenase
MNIAFIGLGRMGWHIAAHLARAGHSLSVYDAASNLPDDWVKAFGGRAGRSVADTVTGTELVLTSLPADAALQTVWDLAQPTLSAGAIWVDHSTTSAEIARRLAKAAKSQGRHFIDAPVSGGTVGAEKGTLAIMAGADEAAWSVVEPVMSAYAQRASLMGPAGSGQLTKMSNQICVAGIGQALAEGLAFAEHNGLDPKKCWTSCSKVPPPRG